jgi:hypothetical protein
MTCEDYDALEARSGNRCELCGAEGTRLGIDHDHALGWRAARGLLCPKCNAHMRRVDSGERVADERVVDYLSNPFWKERGLPTRV